MRAPRLLGQNFLVINATRLLVRRRIVVIPGTSFGLRLTMGRAALFAKSSPLKAVVLVGRSPRIGCLASQQRARAREHRAVPLGGALRPAHL